MNIGLNSTIPTLPTSLLHAISSPAGGRVVLVLGAGCSNEAPTSLPLSGELSAECHRKLVADGILKEGEVGDRRDLSAVAEAVVCRTGSQSALVERFPPDAFRNAEPNEGYLIMAALLLEGALKDTLTLNFDSAARTALGHLGAGPRVSIIRKPADHSEIGARNVIYLHRDIDSCSDEIILRRTESDLVWSEQWEQVIAQRVLGGPITVFVGLGSPASVLIDTTRRIRAAIGTSSANVYVVDPVAYEDSHFASALQIPLEHYLCIGWTEFMRALAHRVVNEHRAAIERQCDELTRELNYECEDVSDLCRRLAEMGLLRLGRLRAAWMLQEGSYLPHESGIALEQFSNLLLGVRIVERNSARQATFADEGLVEFSHESHVARIMVCSGRGLMNYARIEIELKKRQQVLRHRGMASSVALVGSVEASTNMATPSDIVAGTAPHDLVTGHEHLMIVSIAQLRAHPELVHEVVG